MTPCKEHDKEDTQAAKILWIVIISSFLLTEAVHFFAKKNAKNMFSLPGLQPRKNRLLKSNKITEDMCISMYVLQ